MGRAKAGEMREKSHKARATGKGSGSIVPPSVSDQTQGVQVGSCRLVTLVVAFKYVGAGTAASKGAHSTGRILGIEGAMDGTTTAG